MRKSSASQSASVHHSERLTSLARFFADFCALRSFPAAPSATSSLERFLAEIALLRADLIGETKSHHLSGRVEADPDNLGRFLASFRPLVTEARHRGDFINVWAVAGLGRDELRNAAVLAWLFRAGDTHGYGPTILRAFFNRLASGREDQFPLPQDVRADYWVTRESYLLGNSESRIDIAIESPEFIALIEVKIGAAEGVEQMKRYLELAEAKATANEIKTYCVIFLSPEPAPTLSAKSGHLLVATWRDVAAAIEDVISPSSSANAAFATTVLRQFAGHIRTF